MFGKNNVNMFEINEFFIKSSKLEVIAKLQELGLLAGQVKCMKCGLEMKLGARNSTEDGYAWRCSSSKCRNTKSVRFGSWFSKSRLTLEKTILLTYMWSRKYTQAQIALELRISPTTVVDWCNFCREVCQNILDTTDNAQLGGSGKVVQIDESLFSKRKYHRGARRKSQQWVFGGVEAEGNKCFVVKVDKRDAATLVPIIKKYIVPGTTIYSDCWKAYDCLGQEGFNHLTVNHSLTFVNGDIHTNKIEGLWKHCKKIFPQCNRRPELFDGYLSEFMYRRLKSSDEDFFLSFLKDIGKVYSVSPLPK